MMKTRILISLVLFLATKTLSNTVSIRPPGMTRRNLGENCRLAWKVTGTFANYSIQSLVTGNPENLGTNAYTRYDNVNGIIALHIWNVQIQDAGYYVLTLSTGSQSEQSSHAILFVFGNVHTSINIKPGKTRFTEGDIIELNCTATSNSMPQAFRPKVYYFWQVGTYGYLRNISNGPALALNGDIATGYSLKNDGQTLVIDTVQIPYPFFAYSCQVQEEGSKYISPPTSFSEFTLVHSPFTESFPPISKKFNFVFEDYFPTVSIHYYSNPALSKVLIVDSYGNEDSPAYSQANSYFDFYPRSHGHYKITLSNGVGSTNITFEILPPGVPDAPNGFRVQYVTHSSIILQWRCGWCNGDPQTVTVRLRSVTKTADLETWRSSVKTDIVCYNSLFITTFLNSVEPETVYEARIWSNNAFGQSTVTILNVKTTKKPDFKVTCNDISITDSEAVITVTTPMTNVWLNVSCCVEATAQCKHQSFTLLSPRNEILLDNLPTGDELIFDFLLFDTGFNHVYNLALVKGISKSRKSGCKTNSYNNTVCNTITTVIVLGVALGLAIPIILILSLFVCHWKCYSSRKQNSSQLQSTSSASRPKMIAHRESDTNNYENYESATVDSDERIYTSLDNQPSLEPPEIPQ